MRLIDKSIIVTGGANGIGRYYSAGLAGQGARVVIADVDAHAANLVADAINEGARRRAAFACPIDVCSEADTKQMARETIERFGRIDVLVNNAGNYPHVKFEDITYDAWRDIIALNLDSVFLCTKAVLPAMKAQGSGKIINIATNLVWVGLTAMVHYVSAKAGVVGFTRALAREVGEHGITVNAIAPGAVVPKAGVSDAGRRQLDAIVEYQCVKRPQTADDLMGTLVYLASADADFVSGQIITVDGGLTSH